ncbi:MAG: flagellar filament capping protein FliD [Deltaproteobacteria bacterium]|jgi:flagellar hook-associated protein 2|nr:flagellar filament capping protein FliD [Deltaproteobacteria bacterium]
MSGSVNIQGLGNGTDWSAMIDKLETIELTHAVQLNKWKKDWQTRLDAFDQLGTALTAYSSALKAINTEDKFLVKSVSSSNAYVASVKASGTADDMTHNIKVEQLAGNSYASLVFDLANKTSSINDTGGMGVFEFTLGGVAHSLDVPPNTTLEGLKNLLNQKFGSAASGTLGMKATIIDLGGKQMLQLYSSETGTGTDIAVTADAFLDPALLSSGGWQYQAGQNAKVRIDGYPASGWMEFSGNSVNSIPGLSINLLSVGETSVSIGLDVEQIKENIHTFVEATNTLRSVINSLTVVDSAKSTVETDYAESQFETQKGAVLTGNYGVQLIASKLKTAIMSKPAGFEYLEVDAAGNPISGDIFASLAHLGIKTDAVEGSPTYGLLIFEDKFNTVLNKTTEAITLDDAILMDPQGIAELFAAKEKVSVESGNFGFSNLVSGQAKAGEYDVSYEVDAAGKLIAGTIFINGKAAKYYEDTNQIMLVRGDGPDNDADGILLDIFNNTPTTPGSPHTGSVRVKNGFLNTVINMVDVDFMDPDSGDTDKVKGTIPVLKTQYKKVIDNINEKIVKEDERISLWRTRMDARYARLDATLKTYEGLQTQLESLISQLGSGSSSD